MLLNVLHPSAEIREGFENFVARTADGRMLTGLIADQDTNVVVIRGADGQNVSLTRDEIEDLRASQLSLMPADSRPFRVSPVDAAVGGSQLI
jgi:putative heme-binding domain-containing protein